VFDKREVLDELSDCQLHKNESLLWIELAWVTGWSHLCAHG